jgi:hypothetical protein
MNITQKLLVGSRNIDLMREEIKQLIGMLQGLLEWFEIEESLRIHGEEGYWVIGYESGDSRDVTIQYYVPNSCLVFRSRRRKEDTVAPLEYVQALHRDMTALVEALAEHFPDLIKKWAPFIKAAGATL